MKPKNCLILDLEDNEDLKAQLSGFEPGDKVTLEVTVQVKSVDDGSFEADVDSVTEVEGKASREEYEDEEVSEDEDSPAMLVLVGKKGKKPEAKE
jgi:hypothetical protein